MDPRAGILTRSGTILALKEGLSSEEAGRKVQADWQAWQKRELSNDDIVRVILDGTVVKVRLDKRSTGLSVLVALGVRRDGQKLLLGLRTMGGESAAAWRAFLDDAPGMYWSRVWSVYVFIRWCHRNRVFR